MCIAIINSMIFLTLFCYQMHNIGKRRRRMQQTAFHYRAKLLEKPNGVDITQTWFMWRKTRTTFRTGKTFIVCNSIYLNENIKNKIMYFLYNLFSYNILLLLLRDTLTLNVQFKKVISFILVKFIYNRCLIHLHHYSKTI